jgi:hypothetical protein
MYHYSAPNRRFFGSSFAGVEAREQGLRKAYAKMAKVTDNWATETVLFAGAENLGSVALAE